MVHSTQVVLISSSFLAGKKGMTNEDEFFKGVLGIEVGNSSSPFDFVFLNILSKASQVSLFFLRPLKSFVCHNILSSYGVFC